jgi:hypothetical protein
LRAVALDGIRFTQLDRQRLKQLSYEDHQPAADDDVNAA